VLAALILDFDGLILETETPDYEAWCDTFQRYGAELPLDVWSNVIGRHNDFFDPLDYLELQLGHAIDRAAARALKDESHARLIAAETLRPGVRELIDEARSAGIRLGVASSSRHAWVDAHLVRLGLMPHIDCVRCRDDVAKAKPDPDVYLAVLACLGVSPDETLAVEDSPNGIAAARAAGIRCVAAPNPLTARLDLSAATALVESLAGTPLSELRRMTGL
jgi:HAD superfamily hydrolase (TIGR01509 family)